MLNKTTALISTLIVCCSSIALADGAGEYNSPTQTKTGIYLDLNSGWAKNDTADNNQSNVKHDSGFTINTNIGYKFSENLATEIGFSYLPYLSFKNTTQEIKSNFAYDLALKGMLPFGLHFDAFGKLGVALLTAKQGSDEHTGVSGFGALGITYIPGSIPQVSISAQMFGMTRADNLGSFYGFMAGVGYLFPIGH